MESIAARGNVRVELVGPGGHRRVVADGRNTLLYWCADAVARLFAGESAYRPVTIGFVYATTAGAGSVFAGFTSGTRTTKTQAELIGGDLGVHDIPVETGYRFSAASAGYAGNAVTFRAMTDDNDEKEYIHGFLLKDAAGRVLAVKRLDTVTERPAGYAMSASWTVTFN